MADGESSDLESLYEKMAKYDLTKPVHITIYFEETDNVVSKDPLRNHYNNKTYGTQPSNVIRSNQTNSNSDQITNALPHGLNNNNYYNNQAIPTMNNNHAAVTNNSHMNYEIPHWITQLLFEKDPNTSNNPQFDAQTAKLLYIVARNLIDLLKVYSYYISFINRKGLTYSQIMCAKNKFHEARKYYCSISCDIVTHVLLPQKYNKQFTWAFLNKTRHMIYKEKLHFTNQDITRGFNELMCWAEQKIASNNISLPQVNNAPQSSSRNHPQNGQTYNNVEVQQNPADNQTCIFRYGRPGNEISLNVSTEILHNVSGQTQQSPSDNLQINEVNETTTRNEHNVNINATTSRIQQNEESQPRYVPLRSTSRDSGIMSPCCNQIGDQLNEEQNIQESTLPYNMTSLPSANQDATGANSTNYCVICGVNATEICIGCYKCYYCSAACLTLHWSSHRTR